MSRRVLIRTRKRTAPTVPAGFVIWGRSRRKPKDWRWVSGGLHPSSSTFDEWLPLTPRSISYLSPRPDVQSGLPHCTIRLHDENRRSETKTLKSGVKIHLLSRILLFLWSIFGLYPVNDSGNLKPKSWKFETLLGTWSFCLPFFFLFFVAGGPIPLQTCLRSKPSPTTVVPLFGILTVCTTLQDQILFKDKLLR